MYCTSQNRNIKTKIWVSRLGGWVGGWLAGWLAGWWLYVIERIASEFVMQFIQKNLSCLQYAAKVEW